MFPVNLLPILSVYSVTYVPGLDLRGCGRMAALPLTRPGVCCPAHLVWRPTLARAWHAAEPCAAQRRCAPFDMRKIKILSCRRSGGYPAPRRRVCLGSLQKSD